MSHMPTRNILIIIYTSSTRSGVDVSGRGTIMVNFANKCNKIPVIVVIYANGADSVPVINCVKQTPNRDPNKPRYIGISHKNIISLLSF